MAGASFERGQLVRVDADHTPVAGLRFPLNPEELRRSLLTCESGPPQEIIEFVLPLDLGVAASGQELATDAGLHPQLAALERLLREPPPGGATVLAWGRRVVPVRLTELVVHEQRFAPDLTPLRARVEVRLEVLTDVGAKDVAGEIARAHERWLSRAAAQVPVPEPPTLG